MVIVPGAVRDAGVVHLAGGGVHGRVVAVAHLHAVRIIPG